MSNLIIENLKPAESPVDGGELLDDISAALDRHIIFASEFEPDAIALWSLGTYLMDVWQLWPKLYIYSPERECGKTSLLNAVEAFVKNAKVTGSITPSALYRIIEAYQPTILIDEADRFLRENEELNGIINAGHTRRTATKILVEKTKDGGFEPREFSLWGSQVIAGIGGQADTLLSRSRLGYGASYPTKSLQSCPLTCTKKMLASDAALCVGLRIMLSGLLRSLLRHLLELLIGHRTTGLLFLDWHKLPAKHGCSDAEKPTTKWKSNERLMTTYLRALSCCKTYPKSSRTALARTSHPQNC